MNHDAEPSSQAQRHGTQPWRLVIPVKHVGLGKSRLAASLAAAGWSVDRAQLGRAIADDTLRAATEAVGTEQIVLVTSDPQLGPAWAELGLLVVPDPGQGLNAAINAGLRATAGHRVAVMLGDLPALQADDLSHALHEAARHDQSFVPDAEGVGTVLRCSTQGSARLQPLFGPRSAARHEASGATRLEVAAPSLRTDVDDLAALLAARALGLGPATRTVLAAPDAAPQGDASGSGWMGSMQASVHSFDATTRSGAVIRDDGVVMPFDSAAFDASGLRHLRVGQRLSIDVDDAEAIVAVRIRGIAHQGTTEQIG